MRNRILLSALAILFMCGQSLWAAPKPEFPRHNANDWTAGTIQHLSRNTIEIHDENLNAVRRFFYFGSMEHLAAGERVRVFFDPSSNVVRIIKKIGQLEFRQDGQNLGYVHHQ